MTSIDNGAVPFGIEEAPRRAGLLAGARSLFGTLRRWRSRRRAMQHISTLDEHLLRDIGLNPQDFRDAFENRRSSLLFTPFRAPYERD